jgi:hypothetical protein
MMMRTALKRVFRFNAVLILPNPVQGCGQLRRVPRPIP